MELLEMFLGKGSREQAPQSNPLGGGLDLSKIDDIAGSLGVDKEKAQQIMKMGLPLILGKLGQNAQQPEKSQSLFEALQNHEDKTYNAPEEVDTEEGQKILGHVFGKGTDDQVTEEVANTTGVDSQRVRKILAFLAPIALGYLARQKKQKNMTQEDFRGFGQDLNKGLNEKTGGTLFDILQNMPDGQAEAPQQRSSGLGGLLGNLLGF